MGDAYIEPNPITDEERAIQLGESEGAPEKEEAQTEGTGTLGADKPAQETEKPAESAAATETKEPEALTEEEKAEAESKGLKLETDKKGRSYLIDEDGAKIPVKRFKDLYGEVQTTRREMEAIKEKQDLFRQLGTNEYYKIYPEEAPAGWKPQAHEQRQAQPIPVNFNVLDLPVTGGQYNGYTLRDVMQVDAEEGTRMLNAWKDQQHAAMRQQEEKVSEVTRAYREETNQFLYDRAKEIYGEEFLKNVTPEQQKEIDRKVLLIGNQVLNWIQETGRKNYSWEDAYQLMVKRELIKTATNKAVMDTLKGLQKQGPASIDTGVGSGEPSGWVAVEGMTDKQIGKHIDGLSDNDLNKFLKEAPKSVRDKHPTMPWK